MKIITVSFIGLFSFIFATAQQNIAPQSLFVLTAQERALFTPHQVFLPIENNWTGYEGPSLKGFWDAFNNDTLPIPVASTGLASWLDPNGSGSQNHSLLWMGEGALGHALGGNAAQFENFAQKAIILLDSLNFVQGHMRHEAVGQYAGYWEGGIAAMALAGFYAPAGSTSGPHLLASARRWWNDHVAVMRRLRMPDGQVTLIGARLPGAAGTTDAWVSLSAAVNLQLIDPIPYNQLHQNIKNLISADGEPKAGTNGVPVIWSRPRHVSERWVVLRAFQSGALLRVPADHPAPMMVQNVYRWTAGSKTYVATPAVIGYPECRWKMSWTAGQVILIEVADTFGTPGGKGMPNGHLPPVALNIPASATQILGPVLSTPNPPCATGNTCNNDAAIVSIATPYVRGCEKNILPNVVVKNTGSNPITDLAVYYQIDNKTLYSELSAGAIKSKRFSTTGAGLLPDSVITLSLDQSTLQAGTHTIKVWVMDVNKLADPNASNDVLTLSFNVVNNGYAAATYSEDFEGTNQGAIPGTWSSYNPDNDQKWFVFQSGGNKAAALNNHAYSGAVNEADELVMPPINLTSSSQWWMLFDLCHASKPNATAYDSLRLLASTDCGKTFTPVWSKGGTALNTVADQSTLFVPSSSNDYRQEQIDVSALSASNKVIFKFVNYSNNGNSTLIDNIKFSSTGVTSTGEQNSIDPIQIYPNPASSQIFISGINGKYDKAEIRNAMGQLIMTKSFDANKSVLETRLDLSTLDAGIYLITLKGSNDQSSHKMIIK